ncbi:odorant receptor 10a-like [Teleopsis dalmanni]|uniref:odorant receptor 10a-like n=1 Tax=Teleopsis dalmanni TaxID=139649 RepID=UPI0018CF7A98|nr:odorant receptor 10a-like [Teleopsis dalmanni]
MFLKLLKRSASLDDYFYCVPRLCLGAMGYWPSAVRSLSANLWATTNFIVLFIGVFTELHAGFTALKYDIELGLDTLCPAGTSAVTLLKMYLIYWHRNDLQLTVERLHYLLYHTNKAKLTTNKKNIMGASSRLATGLGLTTFGMGLLTSTTYNLKPLFEAWISHRHGSAFVWRTPFNMTLPAGLLNFPYFPLSYIFTAYTAYVTVFMFSGCDSFYYESCSNFALLLKILQEDIKIVFDGLKLSTAVEAERLEEELFKIIKRQNEIMEITTLFRNCYITMTLAHFVSASMVIGASLFDVLSFSGVGRFVYIAYTIAALSQLFIYCYGGTIVAENSTQIGTTIFCSDWHLCNPKNRRLLSLMILRSQRPITMAVPFFNPSLVTFASILQAAGSIIALASSFQ